MTNNDELIRAHKDIEKRASSDGIIEDNIWDKHLLEELISRIEHLEREMKKHSTATNTQYYITVEHMQVDRPILEQLTFQLDSLDIHELSGSLNLGNNFGTGEYVNGKKAKPKSNGSEDSTAGESKRNGSERSTAKESKSSGSEGSAVKESKLNTEGLAQKGKASGITEPTISSIKTTEMRDVQRTGTGLKFTL